MKRSLDSLIALLLIAVIVAGCTTGNTSPIQSGTEVPRDVPTVSVGTTQKVDPNIAATRTPESPSLPTEIPIPLKPGFGEADNERDEFMNNTVEGRAQRDWLIKWLGYWSTAREEDRDVAPVELGSDTSRLYIKKFPGSNMLVFESPDYPGLVIVPPTWAQEGMFDPPEAEPNHEIPKGSNILLLSTISGPELVQYGIPEGSVLVPRNGRYFMADKDDINKAMGIVNLQTGQWEAVDYSRFNYCETRSEASSCRIIPADIDSGAFRDFVRFHDTSTFPPDVVIPPMMLMNVPPSFTMLTYGNLEGGGGNDKITQLFKKKPGLVPSRRVAYAIMDLDGYDFVITVVKQIDISGKVSFLTYRGSADSRVVNDIATFPLLEVFVGNLGYTDTEVVPLLNIWLETGAIPQKLEGKLLHEYNEMK